VALVAAVAGQAPHKGSLVEPPAPVRTTHPGPALVQKVISERSEASPDGLPIRQGRIDLRGRGASQQPTPNRPEEAWTTTGWV